MATCIACAAILPKTSRFCPDCGAPLDAISDSPTGTAPRGTPSPVRKTPVEKASLSGLGVRSATAIAGQGRFAPGDLLSERYRIVALLGKGGMGEVYRADDLKLGQPVALKFLPQSVAQDVERLERFHNEVRIARQVSHPNVCRVYDIGEIVGEHYLCMELVDGEDLASLLRRIRRLPGDKALEIARQLCAGLAAAHDKGVLHRDLKPENVMIDGHGKVRITDFGLAGLADQIGGDVRSGTPAYMSPERLTGREVTQRSDVYALGLVLYELFTGRRAFEGKTFIELMRKHENEPPTHPSTLVSDLDPAVEAVILRCLEKDPRRRPGSAMAVAAGLPGGDPLAAALAAGETPSPELVAAAGEQARLSRPAAWAALAFVALGAVVGLVFGSPQLILQRQPFEKPPLVLADRARELIAAFGYTEVPADNEFGYAIDGDYLRYVEAQDQSAERWDAARLERPPVVQAWYRQSPRLLASTAVSGRVSAWNPPLEISGMTGVRLDMRGRLLESYVVTPQVEPPADGPAAEPDWPRLFAEAKLDIAAFKAVPPTWSPPFFCELRRAWEGVYPERPEVPIRIEAAAHRGRPVWFRVIGPWTLPRMQGAPLPMQRAAYSLIWTLGLCLMAAAALLARNNLRRGRVDRRGSLTLVAFVLVAGLVQWVLAAHHVADLTGEMGLFARGLGSVLIWAAATGLLYAALEPYVRRLWPDALISWTRLLARRWRDPLVGSDVLMGTAYGVAAALVGTAARAALSRGDATIGPLFAIDALLGLDEAVRLVLDRLLHSVSLGMGLALLFVGMRFLLKREWLAGLVVAAITGIPDALSSGQFWLVMPFSIVAVSIFVLALVRSGLLSLVVSLLVMWLIQVMPLTTDISRWYGMPTKVALATLLLMAASGLRAALRGDVRA